MNLDTLDQLKPVVEDMITRFIKENEELTISDVEMLMKFNSTEGQYKKLTITIQAKQ